MPPVPKLAYTGTLERRVEVFREMETKEQRDADGHVAVTAEVAIYLQSVAIKSQQVLKPGVQRWVLKYAVNEIQADVIAYHGFLEKADHYHEHAPGYHGIAHVQLPPYLRGEVARPHNGAGNELREERYVESIVDKARKRLKTATVDIYRIAEALERKEAYAYRQEYVPWLEVVAQDVGNHPREEVCILEIKQEAQVNDKTQHQQQPWRPPVPPCRLYTADKYAGRF